MGIDSPQKFNLSIPLAFEDCFKIKNDSLEFQSPIIVKSKKKNKFKLITINN